MLVYCLAYQNIGEKNDMVKIQQNISDFSEPEEGEIYEIIEISETVNKGFKGLTIDLKPKRQTEYNSKFRYRVTAWLGQNETVGTKSKLGAFISAFTDYFEAENKGDTKKALMMSQDTDNWKGHLIKVLSWRNKNRELTIIP